MKPNPANVSQCERLRLASIVPQRARMSGERMGNKAGASVEFLDHRPYVFGDDLRKIDWKAFARNDQLLIKQFREENRPMAHIVIDGSLSMMFPPSKAQTALDIGVMLSQICAAQGLETRVSNLGGRSWSAKESVSIDFNHRAPLIEELKRQVGMVPCGALLFLLSDFFSPHDPRMLMNILSQRAGMIVLLQVVSQEELEPTVGGSFLFKDAESDREIVVDLSEETVSMYKTRVDNLRHGLEDEIFRRGGRYCLINTQTDFQSICGLLVEREILQSQ
ncbi:MAG: DUF58 domain-containing protein [Myxococcota bacterium]|nr:DUF58 domain-containing protein [Myxococcota bacterium]